MIRGTTPKMEFTLPFETDQIAEAYISFYQLDKIILEKTLSECTLSEKMITVQLSQEETLKFTSGCVVEIQIRVLMTSGDALASNIIRINTERILKDGVI